MLSPNEIADADVPKPVLLHGANASAWPLLQRAVESGFSTRIGLEDVKFLPDGSPAELNTDSRRFVWVFRAIYDEACLIYG